MEDRLREHMDLLFKDAPFTQKSMELKEEMLMNLQEKYRDLLAEGKSEEAAYNIAVAGIGNLDGLIAQLDDPETDAPVSGYQRERQRSALFTAAAVMLYILSLLPMTLSLMVWYIDKGLAIGLFLIMVAAATGLLVYNQMSRQYTKMPKAAPTIADDMRRRMEDSDDRRRLHMALSIALWAVTVALYFVVSFLLRAWAVSWVIFVLAAACQALLSVYFMIRK